MVSNDRVISAADVHAAAERIRGVAVRTPLLEYEALKEFVGQRVLVKFEGLQHTLTLPARYNEPLCGSLVSIRGETGTTQPMRQQNPPRLLWPLI